MKLILIKLVDQHMPLYAIKILIAQKPGLMVMVIVQIQAQEMNAKISRDIISVQRAKHVFMKVRHSLFDFFIQHKLHISFCMQRQRQLLLSHGLLYKGFRSNF